MFDFLDKYNCSKIILINDGLSSDRKYYIETNDSNKLYLRVNDFAEYKNKKTMFDMMGLAAKLDVPMNRPIEFGAYDNGNKVYQLLTWCDGDAAENVLPSLTKSKQYTLGIQSGEILRKIHSIPAPGNLEDWSFRYLQTNANRIQSFKKCNIELKGNEYLFNYFKDNKYLLKGRPQCFHHGDYHNGNILINNKLQLSIIDWEMLDYNNFANPWEEFNRMGNSEITPSFATGQIIGYFGGQPTEEFWRLFALYMSAGALMLISWAYFLQNDELEYSLSHAKQVLHWFDNMKTLKPLWFRR